MERNFPLDMDAFVPISLSDPTSNPWSRGLETLVNIIITAIHINALWVLPAAYYYCTEMTFKGALGLKKKTWGRFFFLLDFGWTN